MPVLPLQQLPGQQEQSFDPFELLNQQHTQQLQQIEDLFAGVENETYSKVQYKLNTLWQKHQVERQLLESQKKYLKPEVYQQRRNQLYTKQRLALITAKESVRPDIDKMNEQKQGLMKRLENDRATKEMRLKEIKDLIDKGVIQDPYAGLQEQLQILGFSYPISALKPPSLAEQTVLTIRQAMMEQLPTYPAAKEKATRLQRATARATRKPGTLAEGIEKLKPTIVSRTGVPLTMSVKPKYRQNKRTGEKQMSVDGGKTWQTIG